jgi:hypothetical protein
MLTIIPAFSGVHAIVFITFLSAFAADQQAASGQGVLRATIVDAVTGLPAACTVTLTDASGRVVREGEGFGGGFRCDGRFEKQVSAGRFRLRIARGFETRSEERLLEVAEGERLDVRFELHRNVDLRQRGWHAGDSHVHMVHGERTLPVSFEDVALAARAEDLQYLSLAQAWNLPEPTPEALETELRQRSRPDCVLTWNLEAPKNYYRGDAGRCLGHCWTLGMEGRTATGENALTLLLEASAHDYESSKPTYANFESHALIHAQQGAVFYTHPARWWMGPWGGRGGYPKKLQMRVSNMAVELPLDTLIGPTFDGIDLMTTGREFEANEMAFGLWCLLLNRGYRIAPTASSDACFDRPGGAIPGIVRTYTHLDEPFSLAAVTRAAAAGRNFVTSGPLLLATVAGQPPGTVFNADGKAREVRLEAWASGADAEGLSRVELLRNGEPFQAFDLSPRRAIFQTALSLSENETAWYCARAFGSDPTRQRAITGAFYFSPPGHAPPEPVPARVRVWLADAQTGAPLEGTVTEVSYHARLSRDGRHHDVTGGTGMLQVPATVRLRAEVPGYRSVVLSPFLDHRALVEFITGLTAEDLLNWGTFERVRGMLGEIELRFAMEKDGPRQPRASGQAAHASRLVAESTNPERLVNP